MMMRRISSNDPTNRRGLVLFMVLVAIIILTVTLVSVAQESFRVTQDAIRAKRDLQTKWGAATLKRSVLPVASIMFDEEEKARRKAGIEEPMPTEYAGVLTLGGTTLSFILADEDARANVNSLYHYGDAESATSAIRNLSGALAAVRLNPEAPSVGGKRMVSELPNQPTNETDEEDPKVGADAAPIAFRAWGQVFDLSRVQSLQPITRRISCFGSPQLNVRRADDEVIVETAGIVVGKGTARAIVNGYRRSKASQIDRLIDRHASDRWHRLQLKRLLSETSVCYSLWVRSQRQGEIHTSFAAITRDEEGAMRTREVEYRGMQ